MLGYTIILLIAVVLFASLLVTKPPKSEHGTQALKERCQELRKSAKEAVADIEKSEWL